MKGCSHKRTFELSGQANDRFSWSHNDGDWSDSDYAPDIKGLCGGDNFEVKVCLDCHQLLDFSSEDVEELIESKKEEEDIDLEFEDEE